MKCDELTPVTREYADEYWADRFAMVYNADEVDAAIAEFKTKLAEKDEKIDLYKRGWEESDRINASIYAELRHSKYKRCLAMAENCDARYDEEDAKVNGHAASWEYISKEMKYWERWRNRWLAIAEKFKEGVCRG